MPKSIPQRQCVGCREKKPKPELIRVVRAPDGGISLDAVSYTHLTLPTNSLV